MMRMRLAEESIDEWRRGDVRQIVACAAQAGYAITEREALLAWERYSESMAAGWMMLDSDPTAVWRNIAHYFTPDAP